MDSDCDKHLCLLCSKTIVGLDNYISHRQQKCLKFSQAIDFPLLSEDSDILTCVDSTIKEDLQESSFSSSDIISADDFFLSLNLQSIANSGGVNHRALSNTSDNFCPKLQFTSIEHDLENAFSEDRTFLPDEIMHENTTIHSLIIPNQNFCQFTDSPVDHTCNIFSEKCYNNECSISSKKSLEEKQHKVKKHRLKSSSINTSQKNRTSLRQAINKNSNSSCCERPAKLFICPCCNFKCAFSSNLVKHLLTCKSDEKELSSDMCDYEYIVSKNSNFICELCLFHSNDNVTFLEHLKDRSHCQKAAVLKHPLICLPCDAEFSGSDDMKSHFSKDHFLSYNALHPIIVNVKKKNLHCCYCLEVTRSCSYLLSITDQTVNLTLEDIQFIKSSIKSISQCFYGVDKDLTSSCFELFNLLSTLNIPDLKSSFDAQDTKEEKTVSLSKNSKVEIKISKRRIIDEIPLKKKVYKKKNIFCLTCKTNYSNETSFKEHLKLHVSNGTDNDNKKQFLCEICGYSTEIFHHLTKHKRYHTGEKPFECKDCGVSFAVCSQLLRHSRLHTGAKPYGCPYCSYTCNTQENLRKHILKTKKHAGKKMYPCKNCNFECNEFSDYKRHLTTEHSKSFPDYKSLNSSAVAGLYKTN